MFSRSTTGSILSTPTVYESKDGGKQILIPESFQLSAYDVKDGHRVWWVLFVAATVLVAVACTLLLLKLRS